MSKMTDIKSKIAVACAEAIKKINPLAELSADTVCSYLEYPPDRTMGDIALPCFRFSRELRQAPPKIAAAIKDAVTESGILEGKVTSEIAGGYLNFRVAEGYLSNDVLGEILTLGEDYGGSREGEGKTVVLDYSSPNVAKPFHVGHLGSTVIGHSLKKLYEFYGYKCVGVNHLGDWGTQFGKMITAYRLWGDREQIEEAGADGLVALYVKFHDEAEKDKSLEDKARAEFHKMEEGDPENLALREWFIKLSFREYDVIYKQLGIEFDSYAGESFYADKMDEQVDVLREKGLLKLDDGASIVDLSEYDMPPCLILRSDGSTLYPTRDIAAAVYRAREYNFDKCIYVTAAAQNLHFAQWFRVVEMMGYPWYDKLVHVPYGMVSIGGEKLATRTGNVILLKDLLATAIEKVSDIITVKNPALSGEEKAETAEAVGVGAVIFHYLLNNRMRDMNFIMEDALNFDGNTGPYAMYTYARTCSIKRRAESDGVLPSCGDITAEEERLLLLTLSRFGEVVESAVREYEPSLVTRYILDLCADFNRFYHECQILNADDSSVRSFRLALTTAVNAVLGRALSLICIRKTEKI